MKRTIEIEDSLDERTETACEEVKDALLEYLKENPDTYELPDLSNDLNYSGTIHEIVDTSVPVYTHEINTAWYLHGRELEEAYENAGVGNNPRENDGMAAIYYYIMDAVNTWYQEEAQDVFDTWRAEQNAKEEAAEAKGGE